MGAGWEKSGWGIRDLELRRGDFRWPFHKTCTREEEAMVLCMREEEAQAMLDMHEGFFVNIPARDCSRSRPLATLYAPRRPLLPSWLGLELK